MWHPTDAAQSWVSEEEATQNYALLRQSFADAPANHPVHRDLNSDTNEAYFHLNQLGEDLKVARPLKGFKSFLHDLKSIERYRSAVHTMRIAAMFARPQNQNVEFIEATNTISPDLVVYVGKTRVFVEAKLMEMSEEQKRFTEWSGIARVVVEERLTSGRSYPFISVIAADIQHLPDASKLIPLIDLAISKFAAMQRPIMVRGFKVKVLAEPPSEGNEGTSEYRGICIICKKSGAEATRVQKRVRKGYDQLRSLAGQEYPAILAIGLNDNQCPHSIQSYLNQAFNRRQFRSLSGVLLIESTQTIDFQHVMPVQLIGKIGNPYAAQSVPADLTYAMQGTGRCLFSEKARRAGERVHVYTVVTARVGDNPHDFKLSIPVISRLHVDFFS